jgi:CRP-like cAMP-binding protein
MSAAEQVSKLVPINSLGPDSVNELLASTPVENVSPGTVLFEEGDDDPQAIYLLEGEVQLTSKAGNKRTITGGHEDARYALAQLKPRQYTGKTKSPSTIIRVDSALLDRLITMEQAARTGGIVVEEYDSGDNDWVMGLLRNDVFQKLPPANFNALLARLEPVSVKAGQVIVKQGDAGDFYYLIQTGRATVARKEATGKVGMLAEIGEGEGFGEEALLTGAPRNATVIMRTEGLLMRLAKQDFDSLLKDPVVHWVSGDEIRALAQAGAGLIDVRTEDEFKRGAIKGAINLPLYQLRQKSTTLDPSRRYVVCCDSGSRSCAAAFLLAQRGIETSVLRGGLNALRGG